MWKTMKWWCALALLVLLPSISSPSSSSGGGGDDSGGGGDVDLIGTPRTENQKATLADLRDAYHRGRIDVPEVCRTFVRLHTGAWDSRTEELAVLLATLIQEQHIVCARSH